MNTDGYDPATEKTPRVPRRRRVGISVDSLVRRESVATTHRQGGAHRRGMRRGAGPAPLVAATAVAGMAAASVSSVVVLSGEQGPADLVSGTVREAGHSSTDPSARAFTPEASATGAGPHHQLVDPARIAALANLAAGAPAVLASAALPQAVSPGQSAFPVGPSLQPAMTPGALPSPLLGQLPAPATDGPATHAPSFGSDNRDQHDDRDHDHDRGDRGDRGDHDDRPDRDDPPRPDPRPTPSPEPTPDPPEPDPTEPADPPEPDPTDPPEPDPTDPPEPAPTDPPEPEPTDPPSDEPDPPSDGGDGSDGGNSGGGDSGRGGSDEGGSGDGGDAPSGGGR